METSFGKLMGAAVVGAAVAAGAGLVIFFGGRWLRSRYPRTSTNGTGAVA